MSAPYPTRVPSKSKQAAATMGSDPRPIPGFPGYFVDETGTIFSARSRQPLHPIRCSPDRLGYRQVTLFDANGGRHKRRVHRVVAEVFLGAPTGPHTRHLNNDPSDNRACNLAWGTAADNAQDRVESGHVLKGERHPRAILGESDVLAIRSAYAAGERQTKLARRYGVTFGTIHHIVRGNNWRHLPASVGAREVELRFPTVQEDRAKLAKAIGAEVAK